MHIIGNRFLFTAVLSWLFLSSCSADLSTAPSADKPKKAYSSDFPDLINDFQQLSSVQFMGRKTTTEGSVRAQQFIVDALTHANVLPFDEKYIHQFTFEKRGQELIGSNIIGFVPSVVKSCQHFIVLSAHYDHLGQIGNRRTYLGADDNASGTAALLSIAKHLNSKPNNHNYIVLFTDAEEMNLKGAKAFINAYPKLMQQTTININMDMLSGDKNTKRLHYFSYGLDKIEGLKRNTLRQVINSQELRIKKVLRAHSVGGAKSEINWLTSSDHGAFYKAKVPVLYFGVGLHENYHTTDDSFENANKNMLIAATKSIYNVIKHLDQEIKETNK